MTATITMSNFQQTIELSQTWLKELQEELHVEDEARVYHAMRAVLQALRDRLTIDEASDLAAQLPMLLRGLYYENWKPSDTPKTQRTLDDFLAAIEKDLPQQDLDPRRAAQAVFAVLQRHVTAGEIDDVRSNLPEQLQELWPSQ